LLVMFYDDSSTRLFDDNNDFCMNEECDGVNIMDAPVDRASPQPNFFSGLPSSPADGQDACLVIVEEQRHHIHSITCSPASSSCSSTSTSPPVVRAYSSPPKRVNWREHMRDLSRATIDESIHRLNVMRGGIEKKRRGKGGHVGARRTHRPGCAMHVWSLVKHIKEQPASTCSCQHEISGVSSDLVDRLRRLTRFDPRLTELARPHRFTYSYKLDYSLPSIAEDGEESESAPPSTSSDLALLPLPTRSRSLPTSRERIGREGRSVSPLPSRPHCSSPVASDEALLQLQQTPLLSEEEMCARLSALPIGYHTTATVAALETALHSSLSLMDTEPDG
ncbi:hypothetical protein PENTCL1PPCAC_25125, partial [Pristionchus entomophagus]